jgi:hypothetical protein
VRLCQRKERTNNERSDTAIYTLQVLDEVPKILATGFTDWIAPESHMDDPNTEQAWMWKYGYGEEMLEALYATHWTDNEIAAFAVRHKGTGWRFPKIFIFDFEPPDFILEILRANRCPWGVEGELRDVPTEPPPPPTKDIEVALRQIEMEVDFIRTKLNL